MAVFLVSAKVAEISYPSTLSVVAFRGIPLPPRRNEKAVSSHFPLVLWGNIKRRPPQVPPFELSPLRADVARGQYGLEWNFCLASSTLLKSKTS